MVDLWMTQAIVFGASFLGTLTRTLLPFWDKLRENPELVFEKKFLGTAAIGLATSAIVAATLFVPMMELASAAGDSTLAAIFFIVFTAALGTNEIVNQFISSKPFTATTTAKTTPATPAA
jgi:hypothetical protein